METVQKIFKVVLGDNWQDKLTIKEYKEKELLLKKIYLNKLDISDFEKVKIDIINKFNLNPSILEDSKGVKIDEKLYKYACFKILHNKGYSRNSIAQRFYKGTKNVSRGGNSGVNNGLLNYTKKINTNLELKDFVESYK